MEKRSKFVSAIILIGWMILSQIPLIAIIGILGMSSQMGLWTNIVLTAIYLIIVLGIAWLIRRYYLKHSVEQPLKFNGRDIWINIGWAVLLRLVVALGSYVMFMVTGDVQTENDKVLMGDLNEKGGELAHIIPFVVFLLSIGIIIPFMEELIYRGIFKETLFKREMFWLPLIITSIVFGGMHVSNNLISFGIYFTMGLILYLSYSRRNNIKDSMMVHMINNSIIAIVMLVNYIIVYFNLF
ncbi:CPBP family intramembrane glutamic endopeptidase [Mammaliicoccus lentus]|uniref:CPBP family intramembrane glutamic endopeptidase n=1 Tax=Mammaliicoccus lentus TaxID=42858 RepID=UPI003CEB38CA